MYLHIGVTGLDGLSNFDRKAQVWPYVYDQVRMPCTDYVKTKFG